MKESFLKWGVRGLMGGLVLAAGGSLTQAATVQTLTENFSAAGSVALDATANPVNANNETVRQATGGYWWGGFNNTASTTTGVPQNVAISTANNVTTADGGALNFGGVSNVAGSRAYTRFDNTSASDPRNVSSAIVDLSMTGATATVTVSVNGGVSRDFALLLRDGTNWYRSAAKTVASGVAPASPTDVVIDIHAETWTQIAASGGALADMDQVDDGGEIGPLADGSTATPNYATIDGMGIQVQASSAAGNFGFEKIVLQNGTAGVNWTELWERY